jgi:ABC-type sugar transport system permease subunit
MLGLLVLDALALWIFYSLLTAGSSTAGGVELVVTAVVNVIFLTDRLFPIRWLTPGLVLMLLMVVYPLVYTVYISFTNYSDGHLLSESQVIAQLEERYYQPKNAATYQMIVYRNPSGGLLLFLTDAQGQRFTATPEQGLQPYTAAGEPPASIGGYQKLELVQTFQYLTQLQNINIQSGDFQIRVTAPNEAQQSVRKYAYNAATDTVTDQETGQVYHAVRGTFVDAQGNPLPDATGFFVPVGFANLARVVSDPNIRGPFGQVFVWTVLFALLSTVLTFSAGLLLALVLNDEHLPLRGLFRSINILPYAIPGFISILIWVGLLNPYYGPFNQMLKAVLGVSPDWFSNATLTKVAILGINTWLGYPYMMLINLGALQSIPTDMYEAAELDGAGRLAKFRHLTLPMLFISVGPMLLGTFAFNFNNFTVIDLVNQGGPPIVGGFTPAGQTDILISYTYRLAFSGGHGADYAMAATIGIIIFIIIASLTAFNFRFTRQLEEVMD